MIPPARSCDIFCAVIDNLGDAGVCWRLARQLTLEFGWRVRLFIDDPAPLALLAPGQDIVAVRHWTHDGTEETPADVVIEAFGCHLPPRYLAALAARAQACVCLNLEYLSAEDWVAGCHGLPSPHAGLVKYFFFPGFVAGTGGLLREKNFAVMPTPTFGDTLEISLFCYDNPALPGLLDLWCKGCNDSRPVVCHVADGLARQQVESWLAAPFPPGAQAARGNLSLSALPFLPQTDYDALLARCHLNFVRGEDSFIRAQWAERPFVWQVYPQVEDAHLAKLDAFLNRYTNDTAAITFFRAWNGVGTLAWPAFAAHLPALGAHAPSWARRITAHGDLATNLVRFCEARL